MKRYAIVLSAILPLVMAIEVGAQTPSAVSKKVHKIAIGGEGGWDYLTADSAAQRLYVSRGNRIVVVDTDAEKVVGELTDTAGVHGVAVVPDIGRGFTSNGGDDTVTAFDLKTLKATGKVKVGGRPDAIMFDPVSHFVFTYNHGSNDATAVDPSALSVAGTVKLEGVPEAAVADGKGHIFVNIMDKAEVVEFDARSFKVLNRWSLAPGTRPTGLALDPKNRRLFSVCSGSQTMVVLDADNGKVLARLPIGRGSDGCVFDPERELAYSSNGGDGSLTVVKEEKPGEFGVVATIPTQQGARTMAIDPKTHRIYLSAATAAPAAETKTKAEAKKAPAGKRGGGGRGRNMVPGSFVVLVVGD
jgi:DNA-binding beta-propeller fold protein YncE